MKDVNVFNYIDARAYLVECQKKEVPPMAESYRKMPIFLKLGMIKPMVPLSCRPSEPQRGDTTMVPIDGCL